MPSVTWYFDFISPFSYLGLYGLGRLPTNANLHYQPILFAGLLKHWGQKGPAEIPPKRIWTYRSCIWSAKQHNIPFRMPASHPFNSLPYLRLSIAAGNGPQTIRRIFQALWTTGADPASPTTIAMVAECIGISLERLNDPSVKSALREQTETAALRGVFGVPSFYVDEQVFWGSDSVDFVAACLSDTAILATEEVKRADTLPIGASRRELN